jgi:phage-related baseplate assembly protein
MQPSSPERLLLSWFAAAFAEANAAVNYAGNQNIPSRAEGENLDALAQLFFMRNRPDATSATVTMRFHISEAQASSILIPKGTEVCDSDGAVFFSTSEDAYIAIGDTYVDVNCECTVSGIVGNGYTAGQINTMVDDSILYFDHCENIDESDGGSDVPDDDEFYNLMVASEDAYSCAGARGAYEYWAKSVSTEISDAVVNSPTPGTICIYALMDDGSIAGSEVKAAILNACSADSVRPLTDYVTVGDPEEVKYNIDLTYYLSKNSTESAADLEAAIESAVEKYVAWQSEKLGRDINPSKLISMIMSAGAKRVVLTSPTYLHLVDGRDLQNVEIPQVASVGTITLTNGGYEDE